MSHKYKVGDKVIFKGGECMPKEFTNKIATIKHLTTSNSKKPMYLVDFDKADFFNISLDYYHLGWKVFEHEIELIGQQLELF